MSVLIGVQRPAREFFGLTLVLLFAGCCSLAQVENCDGGTSRRAAAATHRSWLEHGTNEFGVWGGYSPFSFVLKGTSKDRELLLVNLQYARTLVATRPVTLKYTADVVPMAFEFQPTQRYVVDGKVVTNPGGAIYGTGVSPIGFQANFGSKKVEPLVNGSLGFLYFDRQVPILGASQFNYTISVGFGAQFFPRPGRSFTVGWKYHHLSNNYQAHLNPGIDSGVFYLGFSMFRAGKTH
jgi:lipid A 3-O-deacylase PagL